MNKIVVAIYSELTRGKNESEEKFNARKAKSVSRVTLFGASVGKTVNKLIGECGMPLYTIESVETVSA